MAANELSEFLLNASSNDKAVRDLAEERLRQWQETNWPSFVSALTQELASDNKGDQTRQMAGLLLKNLLDAKDSSLQDEKFAKWRALDGALKAQIRELCLRTLASQSYVAAHGAAMVISKIAHIELLPGEWPDLLQRLHALMAAEQPDPVRIFTLQCLGYICEEHKNEASQFPQAETNRMLTSIASGMQANHNDVKLAATKALADAVEFASMNFEKTEERDYLMKTICSAALSPDSRVRLAAYQCLVKVADIHYQYLDTYIQSIYELTTQSFKDSNEEVAMQAVEFWSTVADVEIELIDLEDREAGVDSSDNECKRYLQKACNTLVPLLLELLTKQSEDQDEDDNEWNVCMSAAVCIASTAQAVGDAIVPIAMQYVQANVSRNSTPDDWRWREAAMTTFGSIIEGPRREAIMPYVQEGFEYLVKQGLQDPHNMVKRTTAWTLGRIFEFLHSSARSPALVTAANAEQLVAALLKALQDSPAMAERTCYAIQQLARGFSADEQTHELTPFFQRLVEALLNVAYAEVPLDVAHKLHISAFEAINDVIQYSAVESMPLVCEMVPLLIQRIKDTFGVQEDHLQQRKHELQGQLCAALQVAIRRMDAHPPSKTILLQHADMIMEALIAVQNSRNAVSEEVMLTFSALCLAQGYEFAKYMQFITIPLLTGLSRHQEYQVCRVCVNTLGDIAREIKHQLVPYADAIMNQLLANLQNVKLHRDVKPDILSVFGDIAQGLEQHFDKYLGPVLDTLQAAMSIAYANQQVYQQEAEPDESLVSYNNDLQLGIINACAGILSGVPDDPAQIPSATAQLLLPFGRNILTFLHLVQRDYEFAEDAVNKEGVALLGDVCRIPGIRSIFIESQVLEWSQPFLKSCREIAPGAVEYTEQQIQALVNAPTNVA